MLELCRELRLFLRKSTKSLQPELLFLAKICTEPFVRWAFTQYPTGELIALPKLHLYSGAYIIGKLGEETRGQAKGGEVRPPQDYNRALQLRC